ncbi:IPTL-CTERM sorting domain-containing protein [Diaphorobacter sp. HDW4A]|uniref:IPTL-CTERM sorting domain-containing protein n=1 Tax=Diaphorobacter sp. HDW4A TaxID=2714924 RepID=UPI001407843D|nr:IPTL-CTERM sorting domain-containing protein [Diaphorobacter sp. HDW4A]QIL81512.1 IPTL-CTERM sorting domain-containing protein [Diaphorobacter sp. HDW4A]
MNTIPFISQETVRALPWQRWSRLTMAFCASGLMLAPVAHADFVNGNFESGTAFDGWTQFGYVVPSTITTFPPSKSADLGLKTPLASNQSEVLNAGSDATTNNVLSWSDRVARVHTSNNSNGKNNKASSIEQQITIAASDVDADGKVHVRFTAAPVLEAPNDHNENEQPYFFIEITKADGTTLYSTFNFANQPGIPWKLSSNGEVTYTDWQAFDIPLDAQQVQVGDQIKLKVIAAGCGKSGHTGAVYLNNVRTQSDVTGASLWVTAEGPASVMHHTATDGSTLVTYTYTYTNNGDTTVNNVTVLPSMPQTTDATPKTTSFVAISSPGVGGGSCTAPVTAGAAASCSIGTLAPGASGTFTMTVLVPGDTSADQLNNGTYPIAGNGVPALLGPLVKTALLADMVPDLSQLPASAVLGASYSGAYSCTNQGSTIAFAASCAVSGLPQGVTTGQCTITPPTPATNWATGDGVPPAATVTCPVSGTVTGTGAGTVNVTTGGSNDGDAGNNLASKAVSVAGPDMAVDLTGLPASAVVGKAYAGSFTCSNIGSVAATSGTSCSVAGLPQGVSQGVCAISPGASVWTAGNAVPSGEVVTCDVEGTITAMLPATVVGQTGATGDANAANNTATLMLALAPAAPNLVVDVTGLPASGVLGKPYKGSFTCSNTGTADATTGTSCVAAGLPQGVTQGACTISPGGTSWAQGDAIVEGAVVTCKVDGTLVKTGMTTATGTTGTATATQDVTVTDAPVATPVPTLSQWAQMLMAGLLALAAVLTLRRRQR